MAFHPFATFRKNQKFWMASLILLCMVTFVLCTGVGGDFGSRLVDIVTHWGRGQGATVVRLNNRNITVGELEKLREQRIIANEFMREASRRALEHVDAAKKDIGKVKESEQKVRATILAAVEQDLIERLKGAHYFGSGTKVEDLVDFLIWKKEAERLGIQLNRGTTQQEVNHSVHFVLQFTEDRQNWVWLFTSDDSLWAEQRVKNQHWAATPDAINRALREEFEVRIAKLALAAVRPGSLYSSGLKAGYSFYSPFEWRQAPSPEQFWGFYKENRAESDFALLSMPVSAFIPKVQADPKQKPSEADLKDLFDKYKNKDYDPTSITPGFKSPEQMKIEWVSADPDSPKYRAAAETILALQATPPAFSPFSSELSAALRISSGGPALDASLHQSYKYLTTQGFFRATQMTDAGFPLPWYRHFDQPAGAAQLVALGMPASAPGALQLTDALGAVYGTQAAAVSLNAKKVAPDVAKEVRKRVPWFATMFLQTTTPLALMSIGGATDAWALPVFAAEHKAWTVEQHLPFAAVRDDLLHATRYKIARELVLANMTFVRNKLMQDAGNPRYLPKRLEELEQRFGLVHKSTQQFRNRYDIADDPALREFKEQYEDGRALAVINSSQGRNGTETMLKPDEYWRIFFDPTEEFSVRNDGLYVPRSWPPTAIEVKNQINPAAEKTKIDLWKKEVARMPILYWKTANEPARVPANLTALRKEVEHAWYFLKAREHLLANEAKEVAESLQKSVDAFKAGTLRIEADRLQLNILPVQNVAPLVPDSTDKTRVVRYVPYTLARNAIPYPRPDTVKELLALRDLKAPLELPTNKDDPNQKLIESVNKLNKDLLARKIPGYQVQILTNQPMNVFYVALVTRVQDPNTKEFFDGYYEAYGRAVSKAGDLLLSQSQERLGQQFERQLIVQLREAAGFAIENAEEQKKFDDAER